METRTAVATPPLAPMASLALAILFASPAADAASFIREPGTSAKVLKESELRSTYKVRKVRGVESIVIDDMVFALDKVALLGFTGRRWTDGIFVYRFDSSVTDFQRSQFAAACDWWAVAANITCKERSNERVYFTIFAGSSNWSHIGMQNGQMEIVSWSSLGIIAHEIAHALGAIHEQSRPDRYQYVFVNERNVQPDMLHNFFVAEGAVVYTSYDFSSIMHYHPCAFSVNDNCLSESDEIAAKKTLVPRACDPEIEDQMGQRAALSEDDATSMARRYNASVMSLFNFGRQAVCGKETLSKEQKQTICDDAKENCAAAAQTFRAIEEYSFRDCDDGFFPPLGKCPPEKEQFDWYHREGARCGTFQLNHIQHFKWKCGCPVHEVNSACTTSENGISDSAIQQYAESEDREERALGRFARMVRRNVARQRMEQGVEDHLAELLLIHNEQEQFHSIVNQARRRIDWKVFWRRIFMRGKPMSEEQVFQIMQDSD